MPEEVWPRTKIGVEDHDVMPRADLERVPEVARFPQLTPVGADDVLEAVLIGKEFDALARGVVENIELDTATPGEFRDVAVGVAENGEALTARGQENVDARVAAVGRPPGRCECLMAAPVHSTSGHPGARREDHARGVEGKDHERGPEQRMRRREHEQRRTGKHERRDQDQLHPPHLRSEVGVYLAVLRGGHHPRIARRRRRRAVPATSRQHTAWRLRHGATARLRHGTIPCADVHSHAEQNRGRGTPAQADSTVFARPARFSV